MHACCPFATSIQSQNNTSLQCCFNISEENDVDEEPSNEDGLQRDPAAEIQADEAVQLSGTAVLEENPSQPSTSAR